MAKSPSSGAEGGSELDRQVALEDGRTEFGWIAAIDVPKRTQEAGALPGGVVADLIQRSLARYEGPARPVASGPAFGRALKKGRKALQAARHETDAPILTPHIPAMIAAATMALIATAAPQNRSAWRRSTPWAISTTLRPDAMWLNTKKTPSA